MIVLESRALTRGFEILAGTQKLFRTRCVALVDNMAAALSFERRRSRNFLVLTCVRKLEGLCLVDSTQDAHTRTLISWTCHIALMRTPHGSRSG